MRLGAAWLLLTVLGTACGACGLRPDPGLKIVAPAMPSTLDWNTSDPDSWVNYPVMLAVMKGLTSLGTDNELQPGLAERWERELTPEGREVYTFHLRRDVRWSDGQTPLTAHDFVFGWKRAIRGKERGELGDVLGGSEVLALQDSGAPEEEIAAAIARLAVEAPDPHTFRVTLERPRSYFLARMANVYLYFPAPSADLVGKTEEEIRDYFDRPGGGKPMVLGPYRVDQWDRAGERVRLVRNPSSAFPAPVGPGEQPVEVITLLRSEVGPALYERGRVGFVFFDSVVALGQPNRPPDLRREELLSTYFLGMNTGRRPMNDVRVRRAIAMALDRDALMKGLLPEARPTRVLLPPNLPLSANAEEVAKLPDHDPRAARALLTEAGGVQRPLRLVYRSGESFVPEVAVAERIRAQLAELGVRVEVEARHDFSAEIKREAADGHKASDLYLRRLGADFAHPKTFFSLFERGGNHQTEWENIEGGRAIERFEALISEGDAAGGERARELYARAEWVLLGDYAVIAPIYHPDRYFRLAPDLAGLEVDPFNFLSIKSVRRRPPGAGAAR